MRNYFLTIVLLISTGIIAQTISKEFRFDYSVSVTKLNDTETKLYLMDVLTNQCRIYNTDYTLYKTINLSIPTDNYLYDIRFVSTNMFNTDSKIELLYTYYAWISTDNNGNGYYVYNTKVINESGNVLINAPGVLYSYVKNRSDKYKLFLYGYDYSVSPYKVWTDIYPINGTVNIEYLSESQAFEPAYPNPASESINIPYPSSENISAKLKVIDNTGKVIRNLPTYNSMGKITLPVNDLSAGIYHYYLEYGNGNTSAKQSFIVK